MSCMLSVACAVLAPVLQAYGGFSNQKAGTSGLRKKTAVFTAPHYTESAAQSFLSATAELEGALDGLACVVLRLFGFHCYCDCISGQSILVSGDGRYWNPQAAQICIKVARANKVCAVVREFFLSLSSVDCRSLVLWWPRTASCPPLPSPL